VQFGWIVNAFGVPAFITPSFVNCRRSVRDVLGVSLEVRLSTNFRIAGSIEPVRGCSGGGVVTTGPAQRQAGIDVLWEMNY
jgi:hypothetical protein